MRKIVTLLTLFSTAFATAQVARDSELFIAMRRHDSLFFEKCFNRCDFDFLEKAISADFSFYHDQGGIQDRPLFLKKVRENICSDPANKPIRKVVPESLEVYPLYHDGKLYGVIQMGVHQFYRRQTGKADVLTGTAKFSHVYLLENSKWILKQVLSYDHKG